VQIEYNPTFRKNFGIIWDFIAKDGVNKANNFKSTLRHSIEKNIPVFPYKCRRSYYYDSEDIRDYIFKGYTLPYLIDNEKNQIVILDIFKWSKR
jgi:plasmid stabilization system protein ParE